MWNHPERHSRHKPTIKRMAVFQSVDDRLMSRVSFGVMEQDELFPQPPLLKFRQRTQVISKSSLQLYGPIL